MFAVENIKSKYKINVVEYVDSILGEGIIWHPSENVFYWVDISGKKLQKLNLETKTNDIFETDGMIGAVIPINGSGVVIATETGIYKNDFDGLTKLTNFPVSNKKNLRFNDGKCDPMGRLWIGTMDKNAKPNKGCLYMLKNYKWLPMIDNTTISNGIVWSNDQKKMFYIDSYQQSIYSYDYDIETGKIENKNVIVEIPELFGVPDGMTIDKDGNLWVAMWGGFSVICFCYRTGKILDKIKLPVPLVTSCTFSGQYPNRLVITSAKEGLTTNDLKKYPLSGKIFYVDLIVSGTLPYCILL